jgi:hypothetical protein
MIKLKNNQMNTIVGGRNIIADSCNAGGVLWFFVGPIGAFCAGYSAGQWLREQING